MPMPELLSKDIAVLSTAIAAGLAAVWKFWNHVRKDNRVHGVEDNVFDNYRTLVATLSSEVMRLRKEVERMAGELREMQTERAKLLSDNVTYMAKIAQLAAEVEELKRGMQ